MCYTVCRFHLPCEYTLSTNFGIQRSLLPQFKIIIYIFVYLIMKTKNINDFWLMIQVKECNFTITLTLHLLCCSDCLYLYCSLLSYTAVSVGGLSLDMSVNWPTGLFAAFLMKVNTNKKVINKVRLQVLCMGCRNQLIHWTTHWIFYYWEILTPRFE